MSLGGELGHVEHKGVGAVVLCQVHCIPFLAVVALAVVGIQPGIGGVDVIEVHAAVDGDLPQIGGAVRVLQVDGHLGGLAQGHVVDRVQLQLGGILLRGDQVLVVKGAEVFGIALLGLQVDVALDAALLIDGRPAVRLGGDFLLDAVAVGVAQRGFHRGGELEQEQLVL